MNKTVKCDVLLPFLGGFDEPKAKKKRKFDLQFATNNFFVAAKHQDVCSSCRFCPPCAPGRRRGGPWHTHGCVLCKRRRHFQASPTASLARGGSSLLMKITIQSQQEKHSAGKTQSHYVRAHVRAPAHTHKPQQSKVIETCDTGTAAELRGLG